VIVCGVYAEIFVLSKLVVGNDEAATAGNILSHESLYRSGIIVENPGLLLPVPQSTLTHHRQFSMTHLRQIKLIPKKY